MAPNSRMVQAGGDVWLPWKFPNKSLTAVMDNANFDDGSLKEQGSLNRVFCPQKLPIPSPLTLAFPPCTLLPW